MTDAAAPADPDELVTLLAARGPALAHLMARASAVRDRGLAETGRPGIVTYSRKVFVPLTTLCRDRCHYCVFVDTPGQLLAKRAPMYMSDEQVLRIVREGQALGCREALLTLGDRPEARWPEARAWLDEHGFASTLDYVAHMARLITAETGLLAHANPGVMSAAELAALRPVSPSMGMMLETTSRALYETPGAAHYGSPDKNPAVRLRVIEDAGRLGIPFTSGILVGIGETLRDRAESLLALRDAHARHGQLQEVIVQNFRAKPGTAMRDAADAGRDEYLATIAVARLVLGPGMRVQAPPNLSDAGELELLLRAGVDDWGGVSPLTADHVNPERPWPHLDELAARTAEAGFVLTERLTAHPEYVRTALAGSGRWIDEGLHGAVRALADAATGLAAVGAAAAGDAATGVASGDEPEARPAAASAPSRVVQTPSRRAEALAQRAAADPASLDDAEWEALLRASGDALARVTGAADEVRRFSVGEAVSIVVNRNLTSVGLRRVPTGEPGTFGLGEAAEIARDAASLGASELCVQGMLPASEDPQGYLDLVRTVRASAPGLHLHAYRPQDVADLADRGGLGVDGALAALRTAGVASVPGTGVKLLSERVRGLVAPGDLEIERWREVIRAAHRAGLRSTSVLFYGHVETAAERIGHLRELRLIQAETGGFTEFVPIPLPGPAGGVPLVAGRAPRDEHAAMVAVSRLMLAGSIRHVQIPWTRLGTQLAVELLRCGGDDLGGTLLDGRVRPDAGAEQGLELPLPEAARLAGRLFRPLRQRATDYGEAA